MTNLQETKKDKIFRSDILCYKYYNGDIGSLKSPHALFDKYLDHMQVKFEQNRTVRNIKKLRFFGKKKWLTIFEKVLTSF